MIKGSFEAVGKYRNGDIDKERLLELEEESCLLISLRFNKTFKTSQSKAVTLLFKHEFYYINCHHSPANQLFIEKNLLAFPWYTSVALCGSY